VTGLPFARRCAYCFYEGIGPQIDRRRPASPGESANKQMSKGCGTMLEQAREADEVANVAEDISAAGSAVVLYLPSILTRATALSSLHTAKNSSAGIVNSLAGNRRSRESAGEALASRRI
jgi:hypothetical protein